MQSLAGTAAQIPIAKNIVFVEGSSRKLGSRLTNVGLSVDQIVMNKLQEMNLVSLDYQFVCVSHFNAVKDSLNMFEQLEDQIGIGLKFKAFIDRDARSDNERKAIMEKNPHLHIWERGSIEGYFIETRILSLYLEKNHVVKNGERISEHQIEETIIEILKSMMKEICERYEHRLIKRYLPETRKGCTIRNLVYLTEKQKIDSLQSELSGFKTTVESSLAKGNWRELLPYVNCKKLLNMILNHFNNSRVEEIDQTINQILIFTENEIKNSLPQGWDEIISFLNKT